MNKNELRKIISDEYAEALFSYVNNHNKIKNEIHRGNSGVRDLSEELNKSYFQYLLNQVFEKNQNQIDKREISSVEVLKKLVTNFLSVYNSKELLKNKELIEYQLKSGDFDYYLEDLKENKNTKSTNSIIEDYEKSKEINAEDKHFILDAKLLEERCKKLPNEFNQDILNSIRLAENYSNINDQINELKNAFSKFEEANRKSIVNKLYIPNENSIILDDYDKLPTLMLHTFMPGRNIEQFKKEKIENAKKEIINERTDGNNSSELTIEEQKKFDEKISEINDEFDKVIVDKVADIEGVYSDSSGFDSYKSDTKNQISVTLFNKNNIQGLSGGFIGIGFNGKGLPPENIGILSTSYQTTNKGIDNLEINPNDKFKRLSATSEELQKNTQNEIVLLRKGQEKNTQASYIFVTIDKTYDDEKNDLLINDGLNLAKEHELPLVVIDIGKILAQKAETKIEKVSIEEINECNVLNDTRIQPKTTTYRSNNLDNSAERNLEQ